MWIAALLIGLTGSLHCAGMCSPLVMTITNMRSPAFVNRLLYNAGRIMMYGILGVAVTTVGSLLPLSEYQNVVSIALGLTLLVMASAGVTGIRIPFFTKLVTTFTIRLKNVFSEFIRHKNRGSLLFLGALNGILPCGLTLLALSFCITLVKPLDGFIYMLLFGVGTLPVMLGFVSIIGFITNRINWDIKKVTTGLMIISGILLIARVFFVHAVENHPAHSGLIDIVICR